MVNPSDAVQENYSFLLELEEELLKNLKAGTKVSDVYESGVEFVKNKKPQFVDNLTKNFGFGTGIEFRESSLLIAPKTTAVLKKGMVFNLAVGFSNLTNKDATDKEGKIYALFIGDTVMVNEVRVNELLVFTVNVPVLMIFLTISLGCPRIYFNKFEKED